MSTPSFRSVGSWAFTANNVANPTNLSPGAPSGKTSGDCLILIAESRSITATVSTPSGWNLISGFPKRSATASGGTIYAWTRIADGGANDAPTVTWSGLTTGTSGDASGAGILCYQGGLTEVLDNTVQSSDLSAQTNTSVIPAFTVVVNNTMVIGVAMKLIESSGQTSTVATFTERSDAQTTSGTGHTIEVSEIYRTSAGSSGSATVTWSATGSARALTVSFGLRAPIDLVVAGATSASTAENVALTQQNTLVVANATSASTAENVALTQANTLVVDNATSASTAGSVTLTFPGANYAISFAASAYARLGNEGSPITDLKNATALGITIRFKGSLLADHADGMTALAQACAGYLALLTRQTSGTQWRVGLAAAGHGDPFIQTSERPQSGIDSSGWYTIRLWRDPGATHDFGIEIFDPSGTLIETVTDDTDATFTNGTYGDFSLNFDGSHGASSEPSQIDWAAVWDRIPPGAGTAPSEPTGSPTGLLHLLRCDEGSGTILDDEQSATDAALTGTYEWVSVEGPTLLVVQDATSASTAENVALTQANTLAVNNATSASTAESVALAQANTLVVNDATSSSTVENVALTQQNTLAVADSTAASTAEQVALTQANTLVVQDAVAASTAENVALAQQNTLVVADVTGATTAQAVALTQANTLAVADVAAASTAESVALTQQNTLTIADSVAASHIDHIVLSLGLALDVHDAVVASLAQSVALVQQNTLVVQSASVATLASNVVLDVAFVLVVQSAVSASLAQSVALTQQNTLVMHDASSASLAEHVTLELPATITLVVNNAFAGSLAQGVVLTQANTLSVADVSAASFASHITLAFANRQVYPTGNVGTSRSPAQLFPLSPGAKDL